jgi:hypothetical protein
MHFCAGIEKEKPGIFDGFDSVPILFSKSFIFIRPLLFIRAGLIASIKKPGVFTPQASLMKKRQCIKSLSLAKCFSVFPGFPGNTLYAAET